MHHASPVSGFSGAHPHACPAARPPGALRAALPGGAARPGRRCQHNSGRPAAAAGGWEARLLAGEQVRRAVHDALGRRGAARPGGQALVLQVVAAADHEHQRLAERPRRARRPPRRGLRAALGLSDTLTGPAPQLWSFRAGLDGRRRAHEADGAEGLGGEGQQLHSQRGAGKPRPLVHPCSVDVIRACCVDGAKPHCSPRMHQALQTKQHPPLLHNGGQQKGLAASTGVMPLPACTTSADAGYGGAAP